MVEYKKSNNKKIFLIDNLRAFAILIVVFGHSIILYSSQWALYTTSVLSVIISVCIGSVIVQPIAKRVYVNAKNI